MDTTEDSTEPFRSTDEYGELLIETIAIVGGSRTTVVRLGVTIDNSARAYLSHGEEVPVPDEYFEVTGEARRSGDDRSNPEIGQSLAYSRALHKVTKRLAKRGSGLVTHADNRAKAEQLKKAKEAAAIEAAKAERAERVERAKAERAEKLAATKAPAKKAAAKKKAAPKKASSRRTIPLTPGQKAAATRAARRAAEAGA